MHRAIFVSCVICPPGPQEPLRDRAGCKGLDQVLLLEIRPHWILLILTLEKSKEIIRVRLEIEIRFFQRGRGLE